MTHFLHLSYVILWIPVRCLQIFTQLLKNSSSLSYYSRFYLYCFVFHVHNKPLLLVSANFRSLPVRLFIFLFTSRHYVCSRNNEQIGNPQPMFLTCLPSPLPRRYFRLTQSSVFSNVIEIEMAANDLDKCNFVSNRGVYLYWW